MHFLGMWTPTFFPHVACIARENSANILERYKALRSLKKYESIYIWEESWRTRVVNNTVYTFVGSNLGVKEEGTSGKGCVKIKNWGTSVHFALGLQENFMQSQSTFLLLFGNKRNYKRSIFFHSLIIEFLWFA